MSTKKFTIRSSLRSHLVVLANLPTIAWENRYFVPTEGQSYLRETLMPSEEWLTANNERTAVGLYQLDLFVPAGSSISDAEAEADKIKHQFRPAQVVSGVILEKSEVLQGRNDPPWYHIPIRIHYRAHQQNNEE